MLAVVARGPMSHKICIALYVPAFCSNPATKYGSACLPYAKAGMACPMAPLVCLATPQADSSGVLVAPVAHVLSVGTSAVSINRSVVSGGTSGGLGPSGGSGRGNAGTPAVTNGVLITLVRHALSISASLTILTGSLVVPRGTSGRSSNGSSNAKCGGGQTTTD